MAVRPKTSLESELESLGRADVEHLEREADRSMARRSLPGTLVYPVACLLLGVSSTYSRDFPQLVWALGGMSLIIALARCFLVWRFETLHSNNPQASRWWFAAGVITAAILWSALSSLASLFYGVSWPAFLGLLITTAFSAMAMGVYARSRHLVHGYAITLLGPHIVVGVVVGGVEGFWITVSLVLFLAYLASAGQHRHIELWRGWCHARLLEVRVAELEVARSEAEIARDSRDRFLATMSHEIRTPLGGILGMSELLASSDDLEKARQYSKVLQTAAESLLSLVDGVLDFSKIEAGKLEIAAIDFSLQKSINEVIELLSPRARRKGIGLELALPSNLPDWLIGDPLRLRQILINLVGNAIKFTDEGRVKVSATWESEGERLWIRFEIDDTGIGMGREAQAKIFTAFSQGDSSISRRYGGTGLGLSICLNIVRLLGGEIRCESSSGLGSTFWFRIPFVASKLGPGESSLDRDQPSTAEIRLRELNSPRVLLVEDNEVNRLVAVRILETLGITANAARDGVEALGKLEDQHYDLILMDCEMPVLDGYETTREVRRRQLGQRHTPIVALTAHALAEDRERCLGVGMDDYLAKPFLRGSLITVLDRWLGDRELPAGKQTPKLKSPDAFRGASGELDPEQVESLRQLGRDGSDAFAQIAQIFLRRGRVLLSEIRQATEVHDASAVRLRAHSLSGSAGNIGAQRLSTLSRELELLALQGVIFDFPDKIDALEKEFTAVEKQLMRIAPSLETSDGEIGRESRV